MLQHELKEYLLTLDKKELADTILRLRVDPFGEWDSVEKFYLEWEEECANVSKTLESVASDLDNNLGV